MANNTFYGYQRSAKKGNVGVPYGEDLAFVNINPYEFKKGMDYELTSLGCSRLRESTIKEREMATEKVIKNLTATHPSYYSALVHYNTEYRNSTTQKKRPSFSKFLKEFYEDTTMKPIDQSYKTDKMVELKEAIKTQVRKRLLEAKKDDDDDLDLKADKVSDKEIAQADLGSLDDAVLNTKDALAYAQKKVKELGPDIKKLAKEVNAKIKKNPAGKSDYLKVYQSDPDVKEFVKLRRMLKSAGLL
jgi:archaellum component FlaC